MTRIPWWRLGLRALYTPLQRWPLLLACVVVPILAAVALWFLFDFIDRQDASLGYALPLFYLRIYSLYVIPQLIFDWCWMNALWHGDKKQLIRFAVTPPFWRFCALMLPVYIAARLMFWPLANMFDAFDWIEASLEQMGAGKLYDALSPVLVMGCIVILIALILWISARFYPWNAAMVDQGRWTGPRSIWVLTRHRTLGIIAVIVIAHVVCEGLQFLLGYTLVRLEWLDSLRYWRIALAAPFEAYGYAVYATASLVIYRRLMEEQAPSAEATAAQF